LPATNTHQKVLILIAAALVRGDAAYRAYYEKMNPGLLQATAPDFKTHDLSGHDVSLTSLRGKVVLLDFWATWCQPCWMAAPVLESLHERYHGQGLVVVGVSTDDPNTATNVPAMTQQAGLKYTICADPAADSKIALAYRVDSLPTQYLIDRHGHIRWSQEGFSTDEQTQLPALVAKLLGEP